MELRGELTEWVKAYKDIAERNALAETPQESADYLVSLVAKSLEGIERPQYGTGVSSMQYSGGFNDAIQKVIEEMRK